MSETKSRLFIVGLGNPGRKYADTRHNVGFKVIDILKNRWFLGDAKEAFHGLVWDATVSKNDLSQRVMLLKPTTFMNDSGKSVRAIMDFYKAKPDDFLIIYDDLALPLGQLRARAQGSAGGQKGLADIIRKLGTNEIPRLRIGIDPCPGVMNTADFVLSKFHGKDVEEIAVAQQIAADAAEDWIFKGLIKVMEKFNQKI